MQEVKSTNPCPLIPNVEMIRTALVPYLNTEVREALTTRSVQFMLIRFSAYRGLEESILTQLNIVLGQIVTASERMLSGVLSF